MQKFLLVYQGGTMPSSKAEQDRVMKAWMDWFGDLGDAVVDGGNPVGMSKWIKPDGKVVDKGGNATPVTGYSILQAKDEADAIKKAKGCPHLKDGGTIEIAPIMAM
jgi:hypothetical protein